PERAKRQQRQADQQRDRDEHGEQQLLTVAQQQLELQPELRRQHLLDRRGPGIRRKCPWCKKIGHDRSFRPVRSRKTSSRLRCSTRMSVASTSSRAHHAVTVASTWGSMWPSTRYSPGAVSLAL